MDSIDAQYGASVPHDRSGAPPCTSDRSHQAPSSHQARFALAVTARVVDLIAIPLAAVLTALAIRGAPPTDPAEWRTIGLATLLGYAGLNAARAYQFRTLRAPLSGRLPRGLCFATILIGLVHLLTAVPDGLAGWWAGAWFAVALALTAAARLALAAHIGHRLARRTGDLCERVAIFGWGSATRALLDRLRTEPDLIVAGIYDERREPRPERGLAAAPADGLAGPLASPLAGNGRDLLAAVRQGGIDRVVIGLPWQAEARLAYLMRLFATTPIRVDLCPEPVLMRLAAPRFDRLGSAPLITAIAPPIEGWNLLLKRLEDLTIATTALLVLALPMLAMAALIRLDTPGPALFRQVRTGFNNRPFLMLKFRTMRHGPAPDPGDRQATRGDPRITRVGRVLRKYSLDELPQLWNVLRGDMSIVGPRPLSVPHNRKYSQQLQDYFARHNVKPGITGWAQANGLRGEVTSDEVLRRWVEHDLHYVNNFSIRFDIKIILLTMIRIWRQDTAY